MALCVKDQKGKISFFERIVPWATTGHGKKDYQFRKLVLPEAGLFLHIPARKWRCTQ